MKRVEYGVGGETIRGVLYEPPGSRRTAVPLVLLAHGLASSRQEWFDFPQKVAKGGYAVFAIDFRGHGESDGERGVQSAPRALADLRGAVAAAKKEFRIDTRRVAVVGHSLGANLALHAAPHLDLKALIALAPLRKIRDEIAWWELAGYRFLSAVNAFVLPFHGRGIRVPYKVDYNRLYADSAAVQRARDVDFLQATIPIKNYRTLVKNLDAEKAAAHVKVPTLVLVAEFDVLVGRGNSRRVHDRLAGPKAWVLVPRSGHSMAGDARSAFVARHCLEFLDRHVKGAAA